MSFHVYGGRSHQRGNAFGGRNANYQASNEGTYFQGAEVSSIVLRGSKRRSKRTDVDESEIDHAREMVIAQALSRLRGEPVEDILARWNGYQREKEAAA